MPDPNALLTQFGLSDRHRQFVMAYLEDGDAPGAAEACGYHRYSGNQLLRTPAIAAAIHATASTLLRTEGAIVGYKVLLSIARNETAPAGVRAKCAVELMHMGGHVAPRPPDPEKSAELDLTPMTQAELLELIQGVESELATRAKPISAPISKPHDDQAADIFE